MRNKYDNIKFAKHDKIVKTCSGSPIRDIYEGQYNDNGLLEVVKIGEENIYDEIQSYAASCDLNNIISRFTAGDESVINAVESFYADLSKIPDNYPALLNKLTETRNFFDSLPADIKQKFNNSYEQFLASSERPDFLSIFVPDTINADTKVMNNEMNEGDILE